jgi:hypothetical protein
MPGYRDRVTSVQNLVQPPKILVFAPSQMGKTHDALANLPRPMLFIDTDVSAKSMSEGGRFEDFDTPRQPVLTMEALITELREFVNDKEARTYYKSIVIDSLSVVWDRLTRELGVGQGGSTNPMNQIKLASLSKELKELLKAPSAFGVVVYATAEARLKMERTEGRRQNFNADAAVASAGLSEDKFFHAFDIVVGKTAQDKAIIAKSRYGSFKKGDVIENYQFATHIMPMVEGKVGRKVGADSFDPASVAQEDLYDLLRDLGSEPKGGKIPKEEMARLFGIATGDESFEPAARAAASDLRARYPSETAAEPALATA